MNLIQQILSIINNLVLIFFTMLLLTLIISFLEDLDILSYMLHNHPYLFCITLTYLCFAIRIKIDKFMDYIEIFHSFLYTLQERNNNNLKESARVKKALLKVDNSHKHLYKQSLKQIHEIKNRLKKQ